jgi:hypothetical protein
VSKRLKGPPILGTDFMTKTHMVLDLGSSRGYFRFALEKYIDFLNDKDGTSGVKMTTLSHFSSQIQCGPISASQRGKIERFIHRYPDVLTARLGLTHVLEYEIQLLDKAAVRLAPYRLAPPKMHYLREHIKQLLKDGVIEPSSSQYSSPVFLVRKSGGEYRAVVDFRAINKRIANESVPLPDIQSAFHWSLRRSISPP